MNDKELVSRMQHGDMQAFDELYERYKDDAYRLACLITGSRTDGEDLAQEAFVTCAQSSNLCGTAANSGHGCSERYPARHGSTAAKPSGKRRYPNFSMQVRAKAHCPPCCGRMSSAACMPPSTHWTKNAA